ncbi:MAG: hypothetical protein ACXVJ7_06660 [Acidimicrobiia bacterium]
MDTVLTVDAVTLTRVLYLDAAIDPGPTGLTVEDLRGVPWREPVWAEGDQVRAAACAWVIRSAGHTVVVDPAGNIDEILHDPATTAAHQQAFGDAFTRAGIAPDSVDTVLLSHIESVGLAAARDASGTGWRPFFSNARLLISDTAAADFGVSPATDLVTAAYGTLFAQGLVDTFTDGAEIVPGVHAEWTGAHNPGHTAFHVGDRDAPSATFVGHLAVTPLHLATGPCARQHPEPERAWDWLQAVAADGRWLIGPLWPSPGAIRREGVAFVPYPSTS